MTVKSLNSRNIIKKLFFFFYPHTLTIRLKRPVYRGFSGEGWCEGRIFPLTLTICLKASFHCTHLSKKFLIIAAVHNFSKIRIKNLHIYDHFFTSPFAKVIIPNYLYCLVWLLSIINESHIEALLWV
mgnify:CR=1 FL=1